MLSGSDLTVMLTSAQLDLLKVVIFSPTLQVHQSVEIAALRAQPYHHSYSSRCFEETVNPTTSHNQHQVYFSTTPLLVEVLTTGVVMMALV
jgi:hypothetical protein